MQGLVKVIDKLTSLAYQIAIWSCLLMAIVTFQQVIARYFFNASSIAMQELEWHLFGIVILFSSAHALKNNTHVRVDLLFSKFSNSTQNIINKLGLLLFLIPASILLVYHGYEYSYDSYSLGEVSSNPDGLAYRWLIKAIIPFAFVLLVIQAVAEILKPSTVEEK